MKTDGMTVAGRRHKPGRQAKYTHLANVLRERILDGHLPVGAKLPTMEELSREFKLSVPTAFRSVQELAREGFVSSNANRKGTIVVRNSPGASVSQTTIACLLRPPKPRNDDDNFALEMLESIQAEISQRGYRFIHHCLSENQVERRMVELAEQRAVSGILLDQKTPASVIRRLTKCGIPIVLFNRALSLPGLSCVTPDYEQIGREAVRQFIQRGYSRVGFYCMPLGESAWDEKLEAWGYPLVALRRGFLTAAQGIGLEDPDILLIPECASREDVGNLEAYGLPPRRLADWRRLGVFCATDCLAANLVQAAQKTDLTLGADIGVLGCFDLLVGRHSARPPSTFHIDPCEIGRQAIRELLARIEDPSRPARVTHTTSPFMDRGTA